MTDKELLESYIAKSGYKQSFIAEKLGLTSYGFRRKVDGKSQFKSNEIIILCELLNIDAKTMVNIFLTKK
ncbi:MAG: hypothetical protein IKB98_00290 [Clostridia bacterium]|nr:hypothetical protein [Clostridia bacterium]